MAKKVLQIGKKLDKDSYPDSWQNRLLVELYGRNKESIDKFAEFLERSKSQYHINEKDILRLVKEKNSFLSVPVSIFRNDLSPLEAVVRYLRESEYTLKEISLLLNRSNKTIWTTYDNATKKNVKIEIDYDVFIPLFILSNRRLSTLENICSYLKDELSLSFSKISKLLGKNKNTVWTAYHRAKEKCMKR